MTPPNSLPQAAAVPVATAMRFRQALSAYARWLDSIGWARFALLSLLLLVLAEIVSELPPFSIPWGSDRYEHRNASSSHSPPKARAPIHIEGLPGSDGRRYEIRIDDKGVNVRALPSAAGASAAPVNPSVNPSANPPADAASAAGGRATDPSTREMAEVLSEAREALEDAGLLEPEPRQVRVRAFRLGDLLTQAAMVLVVVSLVIKVMAAGRLRAEAQAEVATEKAEAEALRRQVVEARLATMQAQVEPHFLFNTLACIDHLIETDPPRASQMQKHLIALLRSSMPSLREASNAGPRELSREIDVIRPYLEILRVRMEDRLQVRIDVPAGLMSAEFPPMMIQGLVENAIKHGLEPKAEGGTLSVTASIEHGRLVVRVADTGLGPTSAPSQGTGVGLANIRERLALLYGNRASLELTAQQPEGTLATLTLPYRSLRPPVSAS